MANFRGKPFRMNFFPFIFGKIRYSLLEELMYSNDIEFGLLKKEGVYGVIFGDEKSVGMKMKDSMKDRKAWDGFPYIHYHPIPRYFPCAEDITMSVLPSPSDINIMLWLKRKDAVITKRGITTYDLTPQFLDSSKEELENIFSIDPLIYHPLVCSKFIYDYKESIRMLEEKIDVINPFKIITGHFKIIYRPWDLINLRDHDFRKIPSIDDKDIPVIYNKKKFEIES